MFESNLIRSFFFKKQRIIINQQLQVGDLLSLSGKIANSFSAPPPATNVIRQGAKTLPTLDDRKKGNGDNNRFASKGGNAIDKERIINIDTLNPYMNKLVSKICFFSWKFLEIFQMDN